MPSSWRGAAACKGVDPELFFPDRRRADWREREQVAKAICKGCPVAHRCLAEGVAIDDQDSIRAGLDGGERKGMRLAEAS